MDISSLPTAAGLVALGARAPGWRPGLVRDGAARALHSEVFAPSDQASGAACALALMLDDLRALEGAGEAAHKPLLWVQDAASIRRTGRPYWPGLPPGLRGRVIHVAVKDAADALFALEEGLRCRDLAGVLGEIAGNPPALGLTATRRLGLAAARHGVPLWLVRHDAKADISSARLRWQVRAAPSPPPRWNAAAPGGATWYAELFRARGHAPGEWTLHHDGEILLAERPITTSGTTPVASAPDHGAVAGAAGA